MSTCCWRLSSAMVTTAYFTCVLSPVPCGDRFNHLCGPCRCPLDLPEVPVGGAFPGLLEQLGPLPRIGIVSQDHSQPGAVEMLGGGVLFPEGAFLREDDRGCTCHG